MIEHYSGVFGEQLKQFESEVKGILPANMNVEFTVKTRQIEIICSRDNFFAGETIPFDRFKLNHKIEGFAKSICVQLIRTWAIAQLRGL